MIRWGFVALLVTLVPVTAPADSMDEEIAWLIDAVGKGGCNFVRNGRELSARSARAHLRSKKRRNARYVHSTEDFIEKIASRSVTSGEPYHIRCTGRDLQTANAWFNALLAQRRDAG